MSIMTPEEVAARWRVSSKTIYHMLIAGKLKSYQVGMQWRIPLEVVEKLEKGGRGP